MTPQIHIRDISGYCRRLEDYPRHMQAASGDLSTAGIPIILCACLLWPRDIAAALAIPSILAWAGEYESYGSVDTLIPSPYRHLRFLILSLALVVAHSVLFVSNMMSVMAAASTITTRETLIHGSVAALLIAAIYLLARCASTSLRALDAYRHMHEGDLMPNYVSRQLDNFASIYSKNHHLPVSIGYRSISLLVFVTVMIFPVFAFLYLTFTGHLDLSFEKFLLGLAVVSTSTFIAFSLCSMLLQKLAVRLEINQRSQKLKQYPGTPEELREPFTLFLRSFQLETLPLAVSYLSEEAYSLIDLLDAYFNRHLATVGIGTPANRIQPLLSFKRYWVSDSENATSDAAWKTKVEDLIYRADIIVVLADATPGVSWEISRIREMGFSRKSLFILPLIEPEHSRCLELIGQRFPELRETIDSRTLAFATTTDGFELIRSDCFTFTELVVVIGLFLSLQSKAASRTSQCDK